MVGAQNSTRPPVLRLELLQDAADLDEDDYRFLRDVVQMAGDYQRVAREWGLTPSGARVRLHRIAKEIRGDESPLVKANLVYVTVEACASTQGKPSFTPSATDRDRVLRARVDPGPLDE